MKDKPRPIVGLASTLGRRDQRPNIALALMIVAKNDLDRVQRLVEGLDAGPLPLRGDCIKTLCEVGAVAPEMIEPHQKVFLTLLSSPNNRMVWGAMTALAQITPLRPRETFAALGAILKAAGRGSIIARDHAVRILVELARHPASAARCRFALFDQLKTCPANQFGMYCELVSAGLGAGGLVLIRPIIVKRLPSLPKESQRRRVTRLLGKSGGE